MEQLFASVKEKNFKVFFLTFSAGFYSKSSKK